MKNVIGLGTLWLLLTTVSASAVEFYVAPDGNDANPGTIDRPFASLVRARDAVREAKVSAKKPVSILLRGGVYYLEEPLRLGPEDSGTADCPIVYEAYPGEKPIISGGLKITGWRREPGKLWTAEIPEVKQGKWYFRQLFVDGQRRGRARLPARGQCPIKGSAEPHLRAFKFMPGQMNPNWHNIDDVEIVLPQWWAESRLRIESIDEKANIVCFTGNCFRRADWTDGWFAENVLEGLKEPGQWYLDRKTGVLHYLPLPDEVGKMEELEFVAPVTKQWLCLDGDYKTGRLVEHIVFHGLTFQYSRWEMDKKLGYSYFQNSIEETPGQKISPGWFRPHAPEDERLSEPQSHVPVPSAIYVRGAHHVYFEDNEIAHTGAWAIHLAPGGCKDNHIEGNFMHDLGAGAVRIGGPDPTNDDAEETGQSVVTDNRIHDCGMVYFGAPAVFAGQSSGNLIAHNEITGWCEWAITTGWSWGYFPIQNARDNIIEYNYIHHYGGSPLTNHSAIYCMGVQPGTVIRHNLIRDNLSPRSNGIILDAGAAAMRVEYNVIHNIQGAGLVCNFNNFGHIIQNNIFADCGLAMTRSGDPGPLDSTGAVYRNIFYYLSDKEQRLFEPKTWSNYDVVQDYNIYYDASGKPPKFLGMNFEQWKAASADHWRKMEKGYGLDCDSVVADPLFVDLKNGDYRLKPESPALKLGFRQIDSSDAGIRPRKTSSTDISSPKDLLFDAKTNRSKANTSVTIYVSKLGDNSDGSSWAKAFHTIQAALLAVPDDKGGHRIIVRPDTYVEANLYTKHKGAKGAYNTLIGDADGSFGSGTTGWVIIDSGDPKKGFKSYDWWSTIRATQNGWSRKHTDPTFSSICWDRWKLSKIYATGGDAGLFWDLTNQSGRQFTIIVEDCVGIGRAFGGGLAYPVTRKDEPSVFRRTYFMSLDWWGDAGGLALGAYNTSPPKFPDVVCEDCTFVGPDNAVQITFPSKYIRLTMKRCRLISLNFSQPHGTPSTGIIASTTSDPEQVHIDFEDCDLMGYKVFGASDERGSGRFSYTTKGKVNAYVQYQQNVPDGFERLSRWPANLFSRISPPQPDRHILINQNRTQIGTE